MKNMLLPSWHSSPSSYDKCRTVPSSCRPSDQANGLMSVSPTAINYTPPWTTQSKADVHSIRRLSQLRHCSKGKRPALKAVYRRRLMANIQLLTKYTATEDIKHTTHNFHCNSTELLYSIFLNNYYIYLRIPDVRIWNANLKTNIPLQYTQEVLEQQLLCTCTGLSFLWHL